jgi:hypothetical protein
MPIKPITTKQELNAYVGEKLKRMEEVIINTLASVGESSVNEARLSSNSLDQTGNLQSSLGYAIAKDGNVIQTSNFEKENNGTEGATQGRDFVTQKAKEYQRGITLTVVAGIKYAAGIAAKGWDVLDSAELKAEQLIRQWMR